jgi:hypothetical protein
MKLPESDHHCPSQHEAWSHLLAWLPPERELERWARETGALRRRRGVKAAAALLRVLLSYACSPLSLRGTSEWAQDSAWARLSKTALRRRLQQSGPWLKRVLDDILSRPVDASRVAGMRVWLADGTRLVPRGVKNRGWCAHTLLDPWTAQTSQLDLTDRHGGEHLGRFRFAENDLVIADAGFAHRRGLVTVARQQAYFLVRSNWCNVPLQTRHGRDFDLFKAVEPLKPGQVAEFEVQTRGEKDQDLPALPVRLLVYRKTDDAAHLTRRKAEREARRKKRTVAPQTLAACHFVFLLTNVPTDKLDTDTLCELYRLRWQIELGFKRWKSLLALDSFHTVQDDSVRATLTAKLLGAVMVERIVAAADVGDALWKGTQQVGEAFRQALLGERAVSNILSGHAKMFKSESLKKAPRQRVRFLQKLANTLESRELAGVPA